MSCGNVKQNGNLKKSRMREMGNQKLGMRIYNAHFSFPISHMAFWKDFDTISWILPWEMGNGTQMRILVTEVSPSGSGWISPTRKRDSYVSHVAFYRSEKGECQQQVLLGRGWVTYAYPLSAKHLRILGQMIQLTSCSSCIPPSFLFLSLSLSVAVPLGLLLLEKKGLYFCSCSVMYRA